MQENGKATLYRKMSAVMGSLNRLPKRGRNTHFGYDYVQDADVLDAVRQAMAEQGLALFVQMIEPRREGKITSATLVLTFADGETGETFSIHWAAEAMDSQDKGLAKAATSGVKYALLKTFLIATGDEAEDPDGGDGTGPEAKEPIPEQPRHVSTQRQPRNGARPLMPEQVRDALVKKVELKPSAHRMAVATPGQRGLVAAKLEECFAPADDAKDKRHATLGWLTGKESTGELTMAEAGAVLDWLLDPNADKGTYDLHPAAAQEAQAIHKQVLKAAGQTELELT